MPLILLNRCLFCFNGSSMNAYGVFGSVSFEIHVFRYFALILPIRSESHGTRSSDRTPCSRRRNECEPPLMACNRAINLLNLVQVGYFSLLALSLGARVIAFEPASHMIP